MAKKPTKRAKSVKSVKSSKTARSARGAIGAKGGKSPGRAAPRPSKKPSGKRGRGTVMKNLRSEMRSPRATARDPKRVKAEAEAQKFGVDAARMLSDDKCTDVILMDVRDKSQLSDFIVIASGTSDRQMRSAAEHLRDLAHTQGHDVFRTNLDEQTTWVVLDCVDVVIHIFEPNQRAFYDLEMLWGDAPRLKWERAGRATAAAAAE